MLTEKDYLQANENLVRLTPRASEKVFQLMERENEGDFLRIRITGGGCNGLSYKMKFVESGKPNDLFVFTEGAKTLASLSASIHNSQSSPPITFTV